MAKKSKKIRKKGRKGEYGRSGSEIIQQFEQQIAQIKREQKLSEEAEMEPGIFKKAKRGIVALFIGWIQFFFNNR